MRIRRTELAFVAVGGLVVLAQTGKWWYLFGKLGEPDVKAELGRGGR